MPPTKVTPAGSEPVPGSAKSTSVTAASRTEVLHLGG